MHCLSCFIGVALDLVGCEQTPVCKQLWIRQYCVYWADTLITEWIMGTEVNVSDSSPYM